MMFIVLALKLQSGTVSTMALVYTTAFTLKMLVYSVLQHIQVCFVATRRSNDSFVKIHKTTRF